MAKNKYQMAAAIALVSMVVAGCGSIRPATMAFGTPTYAPLKSVQTRFYDRKDLLAYCVDHGGIFTTDKRACVIDPKWRCEQVVQTYTAPPQWDQLNAMCVSMWRPKLEIG